MAWLRGWSSLFVTAALKTIRRNSSMRSSSGFSDQRRSWSASSRYDPRSPFDRLRGSDQFCQLMRTVVSALRCGRFHTSAEAQITGAVLRPIEQIVDFLQIPRAALQLVLDHAPTPGVGRCIAHSAGNALELGELADDVAERKLERIEFDRVLAL